MLLLTNFLIVSQALTMAASLILLWVQLRWGLRGVWISVTLVAVNSVLAVGTRWLRKKWKEAQVRAAELEAAKSMLEAARIELNEIRELERMSLL